MWAHPISTTVGLALVPALCPYLPKIFFSLSTQNAIPEMPHTPGETWLNFPAEPYTNYTIRTSPPWNASDTRRNSLSFPAVHIQSGYPQNTSHILYTKCLCNGFFSQRFPNLRFSTLQSPIFHFFLPQNPQTRVQFPLIYVPAQVNSRLCVIFFWENPFALFACKFWGKIPGFIFFPQVHFSTLCIHFWKVSLCLSSRPLTSSTFPSSAWAHSIEL